MRTTILSIIAALSIACAVNPPPVVTPPVTQAPSSLEFDLVACKDLPANNYCNGPAGAVFTIAPKGVDNPARVQGGNDNGYTYVAAIPTNWVGITLTIAAPGYVTKVIETTTTELVANNGNKAFNMFLLESAHVDPSKFTLSQLAAIRGAMWTVRGPWAYGPRPGQADNITALEFIYAYGSDPHNLTPTQESMLRLYRGLGYTHVAFGPINAQSYHGQYPDEDFTSLADFDRWLDWHQVFYDHGLKPIDFLHGDGQTFQQTLDMYDHLIRGNPKARQQMRIVVPSGWEPTRYGWSSRTWGDFADWAHDVLPDALILIHTVADVDAPVGTDERYDDNGHPNAEGWAYVAARIDGWLVQASAFDMPDVAGDPNNPQFTNFDNWVRLFDPNVRGSYQDRFQHGYAGWPTFSLRGNRPIRVYAGEYCSYWEYWQNRPYAECVAWGDRAMAAGADGYLDSGSVEVPER